MHLLPFKSRLLPAAAALAAAALGACSRHAPRDESRVVATVRTERATLANAMTLQAEFQPYQDVMIHGKVSGYVSAIRVDIGDRVKAGDLLATIEVPELGAQLDSAKAAEQKAKADDDIAHLDSERLQGVNRSQPALVAQQDLDAASSKDSAAAAALAAAKADADRYAALIAYTRITAPFAGIISKRFVDMGALIQAGTASNSEPLVELVEDDLLRLRFPVPEAETPSIRDGEEAEVTVDALRRTFSGKIVRFSGEIDRSTRTMVAEIDVPNPDASLKPGMYASIRLPLAEAKNVLAVPIQAVSQGDHPTVMVVGPSGTVESRPVTVGLQTANRVEIRSGLSQGDRVIVSDRGGLRDGDAVTARDLEPAPQE
jgi:RND family efflux transporter MFP subunit